MQFVAHPNCQQHLTSMWYGAEMGFLQSMALWKLALMWLVCVPLIPAFCVIYLFAPNTKVNNYTRRNRLLGSHMRSRILQ